MSRFLRVAHRSRQPKHISCGYKFSSACTGGALFTSGDVLARINVEDGLFKDARFFDLVISLGSKTMALGACVEAWIVAQKFWKMTKNGIPKPEWKIQKLNDALIQTGLAEDRGDFIYVRGSAAHFAWLDKNAESGITGGINSGKARRETIEEKLKRNEANASETNPLTLTLTHTHKEEEYMSPAAQSALADTQNHKLVEIWNQECGTLPKVRILSNQRGRKAKAAWSRHPSEEFWIQVIARIRASPFCTGSSDRGWVANFDFLVKPDTPARVLEGVYDRRDSMGFTQEQIEQNRRMRDELDRSFEDSPA